MKRNQKNNQSDKIFTPFLYNLLEELEEKEKEVRKSFKNSYTSKLGEMRKYDIVKGKTFVDKEEYVKVYTNRPGVLKVLVDLTRSSMVIFFYIIGQMDYDNGFIIIMNREISEGTGYDEATVSKAIKELEEVEFLARDKRIKRRLWINPLVAFKGSRENLANEYRVRRVDRL